MTNVQSAEAQVMWNSSVNISVFDFYTKDDVLALDFGITAHRGQLWVKSSV